MHKTTVYLSAEQKQRIKVVARKSGTSEAEVIRAAVDSYTEERGSEPLWPKSAGIARSGRVQSENLDEWLAENWQRDW